MFYSIKEKINRFRFRLAVRSIGKTEPITPRASGLVILSCVSHLDLYMYLVSIKSFYKQVGHGEIVILNDGSLTPTDIRLLHDHVRPKEIIAIDKVPYSKGRLGVRWGIILAIADLLPESYVIQLDSDTITHGPIPEVAEAIAQNHSFSAGSQAGQAVVPMKEIDQLMKERVSQHVQVVAEQGFCRLPNFEELKYIRGDSGLTGFARQSFDRADVERFLGNMEQAIGEKFKERGSYLVLSNVFSANGPGAFVLPIQRYVAYRPTTEISQATWVHYFGKYRFATREYLQAARKATVALHLASKANRSI